MILPNEMKYSMKISKEMQDEYNNTSKQNKEEQFHKNMKKKSPNFILPICLGVVGMIIVICAIFLFIKKKKRNNNVQSLVRVNSSKNTIPSQETKYKITITDNSNQNTIPKPFTNDNQEEDPYITTYDNVTSEDTNTSPTNTTTTNTETFNAQPPVVHDPLNSVNGVPATYVTTTTYGDPYPPPYAPPFV
ncbi:hypothetical protein PIROE2DRAFT_1914 [Piromyces sp. E2]|nr:hypothetical protein PIROE2DRAFT_1914 [Piromyces sp. E2]|eukprot:OUM69978.1 hypothetical protein PIROE2DRAFT_1914 [Piromyces sp. E2]